MEHADGEAGVECAGAMDLADHVGIVEFENVHYPASEDKKHA